MAADAIKLRAAVLFIGTVALEPLDATIKDVRKIRKRLDVINDSGTTVQALHRRKWRFLPRMAAFPFQRFDQSRFLTADISARAGMENNVEVIIRTEDLLP